MQITIKNHAGGLEYAAIPIQPLTIALQTSRGASYVIYEHDGYLIIESEFPLVAGFRSSQQVLLDGKRSPVHYLDGAGEGS